MDNFTFDEKKHVYTLDGKPLMGVTSVLGVIAKPALIQWAANMMDEYIRANVAFAIPGDDGGYWAIKPSVIEEAKFAHRKKKEKAADQGTDTHAHIETLVKVAIENFGGYLPENSISDTPSVQSFIDWAKNNKIKFLESEKRMYSREWWTAGTCDLVFEQDGKRYVGDVKTMKKLWDVVPFIQCAAYAKMMSEAGEKFDGTCVINIPKETNEVETHYRYDLEGDTKAFEAALTLYRTLNQ
mgnify:CR=1 FL=1